MDFFKFFQKENIAIIKDEINNEQIRFIIQNQESNSVLFDTYQIDNKGGIATLKGTSSVNNKSTIGANSKGTINGNTGTVNGRSTLSPQKQATPMVKGGRIEMLREMIFGTVPLSVQGTTTKIHYLPDTQQILLTKLFTLNFTKRQQQLLDQLSPPNSAESSPSNSLNYKVSGLTLTSHQSSNNLLDIERKQLQSQNNNSLHNSDSNTNRARSSSSSTSSLPSLPNNNANNNNIKHIPKSPGVTPQKISKLTVAMCVILGPHSKLSATPTSTNTNTSNNNNNNNTNNNNNNSTSTDDNSLSKFQQFIITHFLLIDVKIKSIVKLLKNLLYTRFGQLSNKSGSGNLSSFTISEASKLYAEIENFRQNIKDLYSAPRLEKPIWLDILTYPSKKRQLIITFLDHLRELLPIYNTPKSNFFLSNLITNILSYNLTWLNTFLTLGSNNNNNSLCNSQLCNQREHNYQNQFLSQLSQIYGFNGCITCKNLKANFKLSKCILISPKEELTKKFLQVVSYFWRSFELILNRNFINYKSQLYPPNDSFNNIQHDLPVNFSSLSNSSSSNSLDQQNTPNNQTHVDYSTMSSHNHNLNLKLLNDHVNDILKSNGNASSPNSHNEYLIGSVDVNNLPPYYFDLSRSLLGGYSGKYVNDFSILGIPNKNDQEFIPKLVGDLRMWLDHHPFSSPVKESVAIIADISRCKCEVMVCSKDSLWNTANPFVHNQVTYQDTKIVVNNHSEFISSALSSVVYFWSIGMPPESCMTYLEDKLRELFNKTVLFNESLKYYQAINQQPPTNFNLFHSTVHSSQIPIPNQSLVSPISTPKHSPNSSMKYKKPESGDMLILENIYNFMNNSINQNEIFNNINDNNNTNNTN